ncbi:MAG: winged helix-turn-helix transcriptional regulator [Microbacteriaceae bacterium]|nr:winged helix-turn-helix transcriptional regulator [Microbacteriaceae bacterium]
MVVQMPSRPTDAEVDRIFQALADATRRDIVRRVIGREQRVSDLAGRYEMSFAAVQKHVAVLERSGLVAKRRQGREQIVSPVVATIGRARGLLDELEALWRGRIDRMAAILQEDAAAAHAER